MLYDQMKQNSMHRSHPYLLTSNIPKYVMIFHNRLAHVPYHHDHLIGNIIPSPYSLMMWIIGLDEWMIGNTEIFKVPFVLGGCVSVVGEG